MYTDSGDESSESVVSSSNDGNAVSGRKSSRLNVIKNEKNTGSSSPRETSSGMVTGTSLIVVSSATTNALVVDADEIPHIIEGIKRGFCQC